MAKTDTPDLIYLGRSRLHRNRANLIQTLHTVAAMSELGLAVRLYLPPWHRAVSLEQRLREMGIESRPDIRPAQLLHRRWPITAFGRFHRRMLKHARGVYVRSHELSLALGSLGIRHHLELHTVQPLLSGGGLETLVDYHRRGIIDRLIPISRNIADQLIRAGADDSRIHVSPSGVDLAAYGAVPPLDPARLTRPRIVYLGRVSRDRGLAIFTHLAAQGSGELLLVGDCDDPVQETPNLHHRPAVPHREVPALYAGSELVVLPYQPDLVHADGISPMKLFEAMAAGRPVIASDLPSIREIVSDGRNGLLVDPQDPAAWQAAVERLVRQPDLALRIAAQARQDAAAYGWRERAAGIARALALVNP